MRVGLLGFGLIGGSIARALAERRAGWSIAAWSPTGRGPAAAARAGVAVAAPDPAAALADADLVVLAAPPLACLALLDDLAGPSRGALPATAVVTDVASTKRRIVERAGRLGLTFVGGHPMAGLESTGYAAADPGLFVDRPWLITKDGATEAAIARVASLAEAVGARPLRLDAATHDDAVATISHLPLVLAAALVEAAHEASGEAWRETVALAAGGWESMTRLARGDVAMGAGILATNADVVADRLRTLRGAIDGWLERLEGSDETALRGALADVRRILEGGH